MSINGTPIILWCLEYGRSSLSVTIGDDNSIFDLKKAIFEEISVPDNVKATNLGLWNVNVEESQLESNTPDDLMTNENEIKNATQKIGNTFYGVQGNNIRVIVRAPVATEQPTAGIGSLTTDISRLQLQDQGLWIRYNDERVSLPENILEVLRVFNVGDLIPIIKTQLKIKGDIAIHSGSYSLEESKLVTELFNTEDDAYEITVEGNDDGSSSSKVKEIELEKESNIEVKCIENAFHVNYQGSALNTFYERLVLFHNEWRDGNRPYAPYLTIIQSSGSGKTRLVGELRTKGVYVLYICKRRMNSSGYPVSTPYVQQIFEKIRDNKFGVLLSEAIKLIKKNNWNEEQFWELQVKVEHENTRAQFWEHVLESAESSSQPNNFLSNKNFVKDFFGKDKPISVVCCIDEAHELLERTSISNDETYFVRWRRQIRNIMWHGFFNVLLSTNGKIGNFLPPEIKDTHSARMHEYFLFPAYLDVHTIDALARLAPTGKLYDPQRTLYLGIPLWGSLAQAGVDLTNVLHLASQKIRNFNKKQEKDYLANLACMSCSFALEVCPRIAEVEMLIASHMATAIGVSDDCMDLLCTYPSDPILASGALKGIIEVGLEDCLDTLLEQFSRGVVEAGERGELVGHILFLEAYIRAVKINQEPPYTYLEKVPLPLFLKVLCKEIDEKLDNLLAKMKLDQAEIGFNHWTSLLASNKDYVKEGGHKHLTATLVKEAYHRHTAFKMPLGFPVIDHVIPFQYPTDNSTNYGIISIQNKNAKTTTYQDSDVPVLVNPVSTFNRNNFNGIILGIYIDVGTSNASIEVKEVLSTKTRNTKVDVYNRAIYIQHIQSFNCEKEIGERLSKLLFTTPWPLDTRWSMIIKEKPLDRKKAIKSFLPLVFKQERSLANCWHL